MHVTDHDLLHIYLYNVGDGHGLSFLHGTNTCSVMVTEVIMLITFSLNIMKIYMC